MVKKDVHPKLTDKSRAAMILNALPRPSSPNLHSVLSKKERQRKG